MGSLLTFEHNESTDLVLESAALRNLEENSIEEYDTVEEGLSEVVTKTKDKIAGVLKNVGNLFPSDEKKLEEYSAMFKAKEVSSEDFSIEVTEYDWVNGIKSLSTISNSLKKTVSGFETTAKGLKNKELSESDMKKFEYAELDNIIKKNLGVSDFNDIIPKIQDGYKGKQVTITNPYSKSEAYLKFLRDQEALKKEVNEFISSFGDFYNGVHATFMSELDDLKKNKGSKEARKAISHLVNASTACLIILIQVSNTHIKMLKKHNTEVNKFMKYASKKKNKGVKESYDPYLDSMELY